MLSEYRAKHGKPLSAVKHKSNNLKVPESTKCAYCNAPSIYIYYNDGKKKSQLLCKVCNGLFQLNERQHSSPDMPKVDITKIYNSPNVVGLILAFYISFAINARKNAVIFHSVFNINNKGFIDNLVAAGKKCIKIM